MNNPALVIVILFFVFFVFSNKSIIFVFIFKSPSVQHSKTASTIMKKLLFLHTTIIANYRHCTNIQIHRCGRRFEQQTGICYSKGTQRLYVVSYPRRHRPIQRKRIQTYKLMDGDDEVNSMMNLNWLYVDSKGTIWEIGKKDACSAMIQNTTVLSSWYKYLKAK